MRNTLTTEQVPTDDLRPHPQNPRNGDIDAIAESLRVNDQYRPIVIAQDGTILAGNHTYMAALQIGWDTIAAVRLDVHPDSEQAHRIMLADNRLADLGSYDPGILAGLLAHLDQTVGLVGTGYREEDLVDLLNQITDDGHGYGVSDPEPAPPVTCPACGHVFGGGD